jgi:hypothetical protein
MTISTTSQKIVINGPESPISKIKITSPSGIVDTIDMSVVNSNGAIADTGYSIKFIGVLQQKKTSSVTTNYKNAIIINGPENPISKIKITSPSGVVDTIDLAVVKIDGMVSNTNYSIKFNGFFKEIFHQINKINIPFWLGGAVLERIADAALAFWSKILNYLYWAEQQADALICHPSLLRLLAWERDLEFFDNEPLDFFRLRVKFAYLNARDAGSVAGFKRIFARLNIDIIEMQERQDQTDWDVITILITDRQLQANEPLITSIIDQYGRTCRRYELTTYDVTTVNIAVIEFSGSQEFTEVEYVPT